MGVFVVLVVVVLVVVVVLFVEECAANTLSWVFAFALLSITTSCLIIYLSTFYYKD